MAGILTTKSATRVLTLLTTCVMTDAYWRLCLVLACCSDLGAGNLLNALGPCSHHPRVFYPNANRTAQKCYTSALRGHSEDTLLTIFIKFGQN